MSMICYLREADDSLIARLLQEPEEIDSFLEEELDQIDLEKAWHGIHFLLTGSAWEGKEPLCYLVSGGKTIGDIDVGYGPARALTSKQVASFNVALSAISSDDLRQRYDPQALTKAEIYPEIWDADPDEEEGVGYLVEMFEDLKTFVGKTAEEKKGMVVYLA
jgi:uncharacterized protein DUF1877